MMIDRARGPVRAALEALADCGCVRASADNFRFFILVTDGLATAKPVNLPSWAGWRDYRLTDQGRAAVERFRA